MDKMKLLSNAVTKCQKLKMQMFRSCQGRAKTIRYLCLGTQCCTPNSVHQLTIFRRRLCLISFRKLTSIANINQQESKVSGKLYEENENELAHSVMENNCNYSSIHAHPTKRLKIDMEKLQENSQATDEVIRNLSTNNLEEICMAFCNVSYRNLTCKMDLEDTVHRDLIRCVVSVIPALSHCRLISILEALCLWPPTASTLTPHFSQIWNMIDSECTKRADQLDLSALFLVADYWFHLRLSRISRYNRKMIQIVSKNLQNLSVYQLVQLLFFINLQRTVEPRVMTDIEWRLTKQLDRLSGEELGIICMGFFKTQTKFVDAALVGNMFKLLTKNLGRVRDVFNVAVLKQLRLSARSKREYRVALDNFYRESMPFIPHRSPILLIHLGLLGMAFKLYNPTACDIITLSAEKHLSAMRLKDITKLLSCSGFFCHVPSPDTDFLHLIIKELQMPKRQEEIKLYPSCLVSSLLNLSYLGVFPEELLVQVLSPSFVFQNEKNLIDEGAIRDLLALDLNVEIECPSFTWPKFDRKIFKEEEKSSISRIPSRKIDQLSGHEKLLLDVFENSQQILSSVASCSISHILPQYYSPDILVHISSDHKIAPQIATKTTRGKICYPSGPGKWTALAVCGKNHHTYFGMKPTGPFSTKVRQLKILGYKVVEIPWFEYERLPTMKKASYLRNKINV